MKFSTRVTSLVLAIILVVSSLVIGVFAADEIKSGVGFVDATALCLRSGPSTDTSILDIAYDAEVVVILDQDDDWYHVIYNLQEGYMHSDYLDLIDRENVELGYGRINAYCVNLRSGPSTSYSIVTQAYEGATAYIIGINCGWYKVIYEDSICYVRSDLLDLTEYPYENRDSSNSPKFFRGGKSIGVAPSSDALDNSGSSSDESYDDSYDDFDNYYDDSTNSSTSAAGQAIADCAKQYLGVPYVWGGCSPSGFDCSGLVQYVARSCDYYIARVATDQYEYGTYVEKSDLQPGDIVFFANTYTDGISHVGIYIGDGDFIHSPNSGDVVKISSLESSYYTSHYYGARRLG